MEYLTTHDIVWVNNTVTGTVNRFNYVTLEAAMAAQYQYGKSTDVPVQAAHLLDHLLNTPPFLAGNRRTAFICTLTFLNANGYATKLKDDAAAQLVLDVQQRRRTPAEAIAELAAPAQTPLAGGIALRKLITHECNLHVDALKILSEGD
jgi:prophage maintenance system killer protein